MATNRRRGTAASEDESVGLRLVLRLVSVGVWSGEGDSEKKRAGGVGRAARESERPCFRGSSLFLSFSLSFS